VQLSKPPYIVCGSTEKERALIICNPRSLAFALLIAALRVGFALGGGGGGGRGGAIGAGDNNPNPMDQNDSMMRGFP
jgi:hypothetical protein